jgi:hypothetical protein
MVNMETPKKPIKYTCPMHPDLISENPGKCPICGMKLVPAGNWLGGVI